MKIEVLIMSKFIIISAFFLLPFLTITLVFAQYELVTYELPSDYIITYELDDFDEDESEQKEKRTSAYRVVMALLMTALVLVLLGVLYVAVIMRGVEGTVS